MPHRVSKNGPTATGPQLLRGGEALLPAAGKAGCRPFQGYGCQAGHALQGREGGLCIHPSVQ
eukprot:5727438-Lingulodinium_polyedra.AAC.1